MRNRFLLKSATTFALLTSAALPAQAQTGFLESRAPWSVSKVAAQGSQNAYCAMAKQFGQNIILTVARNVNGESSFAIDFQAPKFTPSTAVDITVDPGAGQQRSYKLAPISNSAFVVRLGHDDAFFAAMRKTQFLRFEIDQKSYSFNLADVGAGDMKLDACIAASVMPAAGKAAPSIAAAPTQSVEQQNLADGSMMPMPSAQGSSDMVARASTLQNENAALRAQLEQASSAQLVGSLQSENTRLKNQLASLQQNSSMGGEQMDALGSEIAKLRAQNAQLNQQLGNAEMLGNTVQANQQELELLRSQNAELQQNISQNSSTQSSVIASLQEQLKAAQAQNAALAQKENAESQAQAQLGTLTSKITALETENANLKTQLGSAQASISGAQNSARSEVAKLREENTALKAQITQIALQKDNNATTMQALQVENSNLKDQLAQLEGQASQLASLRQTVAAMTQENRKWVSGQQNTQTAAIAPQAVTAEPETKAINEVVQAAAQPQPLGPQPKAQAQTEQAPPAGMNAISPMAGGGEEQIASVTEAQKQERNLIESMKTPQKSEKMVVRASEDPFKDIESSDNFSGYKTTPEGKVVEQNADERIEATANVMPDPTLPMFGAPTAPAVMASAQPAPAFSGRMSSGNFDSLPPVAEAPMPADIAGMTPSEMRVRRRKEAASMAAMNAETSFGAQGAQMDMPLTPEEQKQMRQASVSPEMQPAASMPQKASGNVYKSNVSIQKILSDAGIIKNEQVQLVSQASDGNKAAYQWKASDVYGSAVQEPLSNADSFDTEVKEYINNTQARCEGDFAVTPTDTQQVGNKRIDSYEIACISKDVNSSASIVFFSIDGVFTAVAHESPTAQLATAMEIRDRLAREVAGS